MLKKYIIISFLTLALVCCGTLAYFGQQAEKGHVPASYGKYKIDCISNEAGLATGWTLTESLSGCGLGNDDFIKYAMSRIDPKRNFQFIAFTSGKPLVGEECLRTAYIFYLRGDK